LVYNTKQMIQCSAFGVSVAQSLSLSNASIVCLWASYR
jgi:hypothetical protein